MAEGPTPGFGVDIGGSGIKGATVDLDAGVLTMERIRIPTPQPATPEAVCRVVDQLVDQAGWQGEIGLTLPAVVERGVAWSAANIDRSWIGTDVVRAVGEATGRPATVLNDADAEELAEVRFGAAKGVRGVVLVLVLGTGIGSALFVDGALLPNTELGHLEIDGGDAEQRASASAREREDLSYKRWAPRVEKYLRHVDFLLRPDLVVLGGGVSKKAEKWMPLLDVRPELRPAALQNGAGIVGAALVAHEDVVIGEKPDQV